MFSVFLITNNATRNSPAITRSQGKHVFRFVSMICEHVLCFSSGLEYPQEIQFLKLHIGPIMFTKMGELVGYAVKQSG